MNTVFYRYDVGHKAKMAAMSIYGKNPLKFFTGTTGPFRQNLVCSIEDSSPP